MTQLDPVQSALPVPSRLGQGTAVEQSRAIAEVQAAVVVAQQIPRDVGAAQREMMRSCGQKSLAEKAFFRFPRGGQTISGPSVQLARELARCFGNIQYGITELRRDDSFGQSEMLAFAWDIQTNTRSSTTFIVPHRRDKRGGAEQLIDQRDIYENNANNGARRLREMIFAILPGWYTEDAVAACYETLAGDTKDLPQRIGQCVESFHKLGVRSSQLVQKIGAPVEKWTPYDLAQLQVIYRSLMRHEITKEDEFGSGQVSAGEIKERPPAEQHFTQAAVDQSVGFAAGVQAASQQIHDGGEIPAEVFTAEAAEVNAEAAPTAQEPAGRAGQKSITDALALMGVTERGEKLSVCSVIVRRWLTAGTQLFASDVTPIVDTISAMSAWATEHELDPHTHLTGEVLRMRKLWQQDEPSAFEGERQ